MPDRTKCALVVFGKRAHFLCCTEVNQIDTTNHFCVVREKKKELRRNCERQRHEHTDVFKVKVNSCQSGVTFSMQIREYAELFCKTFGSLSVYTQMG